MPAATIEALRRPRGVSLAAGAPIRRWCALPRQPRSRTAICMASVVVAAGCSPDRADTGESASRVTLATDYRLSGRFRNVSSPFGSVWAGEGCRTEERDGTDGAFCVGLDLEFDIDPIPWAPDEYSGELTKAMWLTSCPQTWDGGARAVRSDVSSRYVAVSDVGLGLVQAWGPPGSAEQSFRLSAYWDVHGQNHRLLCHFVTADVLQCQWERPDWPLDWSPADAVFLFERVDEAAPPMFCDQLLERTLLGWVPSSADGSRSVSP